jgi:hypothetical protein
MVMDARPLIIGGLLFAAMGVVHGLLTALDVRRPTQFTPRDDAVRIAMRSTTIRFFRARTSVWDAWLGFNLSHSLGLFVFGAATVWLGLNLERVQPSPGLLAMPAVVGLCYVFLAVRFWFYLPALGAAVATACFLATWWRV